MKWLKRLLLLVALLLLGMIALSMIGMHYLRGVPEYYRSYDWTPQQRTDLSMQAFNKLVTAREAAAAARARETQRYAHGGSADAATQPASLSLSFSEEEINAFLFHNAELVPGLKHAVEQYITDPGIYMKDGRLILAGGVKELGIVASLHFQPALDKDGKLHVKLVETTGGRLSIPRALIESRIQRLQGAIAARMPGWKRSAAMNRDGSCNADTVGAAMGKLLLGALDDQPVEPVLFMPDDSRIYSPLRIAELVVEGHSLKLKLRPMTAEERREAFERIRQ